MRPARPSRRLRLAFWIDQWVGPALCCAALPLKRLVDLGSRRRLPDRPERILVLKFWGLGSIVLASPLFRAIRSRYPEAEIHLVTLAENAALLDHLPDVERVLPIDLSRGIPAFAMETWQVLREIRAQRYDLLLDLEFFTSYSALFSFLATARYSCGFSSRRRLRGRLHDRQIPFNGYLHVARNFLALLDDDPTAPADTFDVATESALPRIAPPACDRASLMEKLAGRSGWRPARPLVVVNPNTGQLALERRWPEAQMVAFLRRLAEVTDATIALTGSASERSFVASLVAASGGGERLLDLAGELTLGELVALLERAEVVVSNDSGPLHLAAAAGASTVALFGPETPTLYGPLRARPGQQHRVHYLQLACSPCMNVHDNKMLSCWFVEAACMAGISVDDVLDSTATLLRASEEAGERAQEPHVARTLQGVPHSIRGGS